MVKVVDREAELMVGEVVGVVFSQAVHRYSVETESEESEISNIALPGRGI